MSFVEKVVECSNPTAECPNPERWQMYDSMSAEVEVLNFLGQLVKTIKPNLIVETGTHLGFSAEYMGFAMEGKGNLLTCEINPDLAFRATESIRVAGLSEVVDVICDSSLNLEVNENIDLLFCDSDHEIRIAEIEHFWDKLTPQSIIIVHDVNSGCHNEYRQRFIEWAKGRLSVVLFSTPRGLALCQKL